MFNASFRAKLSLIPTVTSLLVSDWAERAAVPANIKKKNSSVYFFIIYLSFQKSDTKLLILCMGIKIPARNLLTIDKKPAFWLVNKSPTTITDEVKKFWKKFSLFFVKILTSGRWLKLLKDFSDRVKTKKRA